MVESSSLNPSILNEARNYVCRSIQEGNISNLTNLFLAGFPIYEYCNIPGQNLFITAALLGPVEVLQFIKAQDTANILPVNQSDNNGRTALHMACHSGDRSKIEYLMALNADPHS